MSNKKEVLIFSPYVPYDTVGHAGGKTHNYYTKALQNSNLFDVTIISFGSRHEKDKMTLQNYGVNCFFEFSVFPGNIIRRISDNILSKSHFSKGRFLPYPYFKKHFLKTAKSLKKQGYNPDVIYLEWTMVGILIKDIKKIFPNAVFGIMEVDLVFQAMERLLNFSKGFTKFLIKHQLNNAKKAELSALNEADFIVVQNCKDNQILTEIGIKGEKIIEIAPYYESKNSIKLDYNNRDILFYGDMKRPENYLSAIWLIKNIYNKIKDKYKDVNLYIVGGGPPEELHQYNSDRIIVTGFVDDPNNYFKKSLCLVAPLQLGAGIKVKIIEAMSAGMVVITNDIGIEGIPATDGIHYLHAKEVDDYIAALEKVLANPNKCREIGTTCKTFIEESINFEKSSVEFANRLYSFTK